VCKKTKKEKGKERIERPSQCHRVFLTHLIISNRENAFNPISLLPTGILGVMGVGNETQDLLHARQMP
jgi:hypothetical protein